MADKTPTGEAIRTLRNLANLTLDELAALTGSAPAYISRVENGLSRPTPQWVGNVTVVLGKYLKSDRPAA